jgi:hypothetical protein
MSATFSSLVAPALESNFYKPDVQAAKILYAAIAGHRLAGQPIWPMLIAPPGSLKTELLKSLSQQPHIYSVDSITPRTFLSGQFGNRPGEQSSLLHRIGPSGIILIPDFSTILSKRVEERGQIYADMRRIFDGELEKHFGTRDGSVKWSGRITIAVAATPSVDGYLSFEGALGDRFVRVRMERADVRAALFAQKLDFVKVRAAMNDAAGKLFAGLSPTTPDLSDAMAVRVVKLAELVAIGRTHLEREAYSREIVSGGAEDAESATRLSQQFAQLAKTLALIERKEAVGEAEFADVRRVAFDTLPPRRAAILDSIIAGKKVSKTDSPTFFAIGDLVHLGLIANGETLTDLTKDLIAA